MRFWIGTFLVGPDPPGLKDPEDLPQNTEVFQKQETRFLSFDTAFEISQQETGFLRLL